jgi:hypothetical protein
VASFSSDEEGGGDGIPVGQLEACDLDAAQSHADHEVHDEPIPVVMSDEQEPANGFFGLSSGNSAGFADPWDVFGGVVVEDAFVDHGPAEASDDGEVGASGGRGVVADRGQPPVDGVPVEVADRAVTVDGDKITETANQEVLTPCGDLAPLFSSPKPPLDVSG